LQKLGHHLKQSSHHYLMSQAEIDEIVNSTEVEFDITATPDRCLADTRSKFSELRLLAASMTITNTVWFTRCRSCVWDLHCDFLAGLVSVATVRAPVEFVVWVRRLRRIGTTRRRELAPTGLVQRFVSGLNQSGNAFGTRF